MKNLANIETPEGGTSNERPDRTLGLSDRDDTDNAAVDSLAYTLIKPSRVVSIHDAVNQESSESIRIDDNEVQLRPDNSYKAKPLLKQYSGHIDGIDGSQLVGWFYSGEEFPDIPQIVLRTSAGDKVYDCSEYRSDLHNLSVNNGYCGFRVPIGLEHGESFQVFSDDLLWELPRNEKVCLSKSNGMSVIMSEFRESVDHVHVNQHHKTHKIAVFSIFLSDPRSYSYHRETIKTLHDLGYLVVQVVPINGGSTTGRAFNAEIYKYADVTIVRENIGYDFGSYATGVNYVLDNYKCKEVMLINDSIIGTGTDPSLLQNISGARFWGVTESFEHNYHIQSYCFGFDLSEERVSDAVKEFFFGRGLIYSNDKKQVIENFELAMAKFFDCKGIKPYILLKHEDLYSSFANDKYYEKKYFDDYMQRPRDSFQLNVSHFFWRECIKLGFPFIKKELITRNPTGYPQLNAALFDLLPYENVLRFARDFY